MKTRVDPRLRDEAKKFALRFACADCAHLGPRGCAHGYPPGPRPDALDREEVVFCKEFELA